MSKNQDKKWINKAARMAHEVCRAYDLARAADALPIWKELSKETKGVCRQEVVSILASGATTPEEWFAQHSLSSSEELKLMNVVALADLKTREYLVFTAVTQTLRLVG